VHQVVEEAAEPRADQCAGEDPLHHGGFFDPIPANRSPTGACSGARNLQVRPIYHWLANRVRAQVFRCMLAYNVEWQMRARLAPMLYDDADKQAAEAARDSFVAKAGLSP
jgi:hypothetical protein